MLKRNKLFCCVVLIFSFLSSYAPVAEASCPNYSWEECSGGDWTCAWRGFTCIERNACTDSWWYTKDCEIRLLECRRPWGERYWRYCSNGCKCLIGDGS